MKLVALNDTHISTNTSIVPALNRRLVIRTGVDPSASALTQDEEHFGLHRSSSAALDGNLCFFFLFC